MVYLYGVTMVVLEETILPRGRGAVLSALLGDD